MTEGGASPSVSLPHPLEDLGRPLERLDFLVGEVAHAPRQVGVLAPAQAPQPLAAGAVDADQGAAPVLRVAGAVDQPLPLAGSRACG